MKSLLTCIYDLYELGVVSGVMSTKLESQESEITFQFSSSLCTAAPSPQKNQRRGVCDSLLLIMYCARPHDFFWNVWKMI